jgi:hypothetical protein
MNCLNCKYNPYLGTASAAEWFDCVHHITGERGPNWQQGDPAMVNYRTGDVAPSEIGHFDNCPTHEPA